MQPGLLEILCCPVCRGELRLTIASERDGEIWTGTLSCPKCPAEYPIEDGIPNLLPPDSSAPP
ncbi:MAG: methytransferase partner Trm112 [Thermoplasmata archaeon]|nr:methytransferase partner Trm112 [Thermoplasmata archaeon]